jgi:hypothetical protein
MKKSASPAEQPLPGWAGRIVLEREGQGWIGDVVASAREVPWVLSVLQLLWTAGPVVFLAMHAGHLIGFGRPATAQNVVFFAAYTFLFGAIGLLARFAAGAVRQRRQLSARRNLTRVVDLLPDLIFAARDLGLAELTAAARQREGAHMLLVKADIGPASVRVGVEELTGDRVLAQAAERIEIFRRLGMFSRVRELVAESAARREAAIAKLDALAPAAAETLRARLVGSGPSQDEGVPRGEGFIERIFAAADRDDPELIGLADVEDLLLLILELISGREILRLTFGYEGSWRLARALDQVEQARNGYRLAQGTAASDLRSLVTWLVDSGSTGMPEEALRLRTDELLERTLTALRVLLIAGKRVGGDPQRQMLRLALTRIKRLRRAGGRIRSERARYEQALAAWLELQRGGGGRSAPSARNRGLRIRERSIRLGDEQKLVLAQALCGYLDELKVQIGPQGVLRGAKPFGAQDAKRLAIRAALILETVVDLGDASIRRAIASSNAISLYGLEFGFSADAKAGLAAAAVKEVRQDPGPMAERLALRLVEVYRVPLSAGMIDFLADNYGARRPRLEAIAALPAADTQEPRSQEQLPPSGLLALDSPPWREFVAAAERLLEGRPSQPPVA